MADARCADQGAPTGLPDRLQGDSAIPLQGWTDRLGDGNLLSGILEFFEEGVAADKGVLELIGSDVAAFCDDLVKDSRTYADLYQESIHGQPGGTEK